MFWTIALSVVAAVVLISLAVPTLRRVWAFNLYACKYVLLWLGDLTRIRPLVLRLSGRRYKRLTRPLALRLFCEDMGPTFIKFGQIVASSAGMFPRRYTDEFQKCLDRVRPFSYAEVEGILRDELGAERAAGLVDIEPRQLASASVAQVHTARLADGTDVVVKVQRPRVDGRVRADMRIMRTMAAIAEKLVRDAELANPVGVVDDLGVTLREEMDFRKEATNLDTFNDIMRELGHQDVRAPVPHWDMTTSRVLVMERFFGTRVDHAHLIEDREVNAEDKLVAGVRGWFQCVMFYGFFHGDVHAGNLMLLDDGDIGFLDFGIVGRFDEEQKRMVTDYLVAFSTGDFKTLARVICDMGGVTADIDMDAFAADLEATYSPMLQLAFGDINYADFIPKINEVATRHRMYMPKEFVLITKQMLYFDRYAKLLAPQLNIFRDPRLLTSMILDIQKARALDAQAQQARATPQPEAGARSLAPAGPS